MNELFSIMHRVSNSKSEQNYGEAREGEQKRSAISSKLLEKQSSWKIGTPIEAGLAETIKWFSSKN